MYQSNYLARKLREASLSSPDKIFIENTFLKTKLSYQDFFHNCEKIAQVLLNEGVQPGDRVLNYTVKTVSSLELYVGTILAGAVYVPINPAYIEVEDLAYFIENVEPAIIVCMPESQTLLTQLSSRVNVLAMFTLAATPFLDNSCCH